MNRTQMHQLASERNRRNLTQKMLADFTELTKSTIERAEAGKAISAYARQRICEFLNKTSEELGLVSEERQSRTQLTHLPTRFLSMRPEELIRRYADERENLLELKTDAIEMTLPQVVIFDNGRTRLPTKAITVQLDKLRPQYMIPPQIAGKAKDILEEVEHHFHDSTTIRLNDIRKTESTINLVVSKAHYLQYTATNYAMDALLKEKGWTRSLRDTVHPTTRLCMLEESLLANHIGIGVLIFTVDNYLVIPIRSKENVGIWRQQVMPSISAATSFDDDMYSIAPAPVYTWIREGREELGIENSDFVEGGDIFLQRWAEVLSYREMVFCPLTRKRKAQSSRSPL